MTDGAKPQAGHVAAPKALAELDSPRCLFIFYGNVDIHFSLNLCQLEDLEVETDTSSSWRQPLLNAGRPCRGIQQGTTDVRHGNQYTQARRNSVQHYSYMDRLYKEPAVPYGPTINITFIINSRMPTNLHTYRSLELISYTKLHR